MVASSPWPVRRLVLVFLETGGSDATGEREVDACPMIDILKHECRCT